MDQDSKLVPVERKAGGALETIPAQGPAPYAPWEQPTRDTHLLDYLIILRKHQWLILFFLLAVVSIVAVATFKMQPVYVATARIEIDRENQNILPFQSASYELYWDLENYIETQARILQSETLAFLTIKSLDLVRNPAFGGSPNATLPASLGNSANPARRPPILGAFLGGLGVKRVPNSRLLEVQFEREV